MTKMQVVLPTSGVFANGAQFVTHPTKSCILTYWDKYLQHQEDGYTMNDVEICQVKHSTHLGIHRDSSKKANITETVNIGRQTAYMYSLLGVVLYCSNGQKQSVCGKLW